jgi:cytochrome bd-type quinol oxidase subunit 2
VAGPAGATRGRPERAALVPWSRELVVRSAKRAAFPALVWVAFLPLFDHIIRVPWALSAPLGCLALVAGVAWFERRHRDTTAVAFLGTLAVLFAAMVLAAVAAFLAGIR